MPPAAHLKYGALNAKLAVPSPAVFTLIAVLGVLLNACTPIPELKPDELIASPVGFDALAGWDGDDHGAALAAFRRSCENPKQSGGPLTITYSDWQAPCAAARKVGAGDQGAARGFFERWFRPFRVAGGAKDSGLITGYFEAELRGARRRGGRYRVPIFRLPDDHVSVDLSLFDPALSGRWIVGRVDAGTLRPYYARGDIAAGALSGRSQELLWVDDAIDAFVLHIQGSGRVILPDGAVVRIGYAGSNGWPYRSIGQELIERGALRRGYASWDEIRSWIDANRDRVKALLAVNRRYIFFREIDGDGPIGAAGTVLTPGRSLAIDPRFMPFGAPVWLDTVWPDRPDQPLRRLMIAQDSGNAIRGVVRGDYFWGYGAKALAFAGRMKSQGRYFVLLPKAAAARLVGS